MNLLEGFNYLNFMVNKESSGGEVSPQQFNTLLTVVNNELFNQKVGEAKKYADKQNISFDEAINIFKSLQEFRVTVAAVFAGGSYTLPLNYSYWVNMFTTYNGQLREIKALGDKDFADRRTNLLGPKLTEYPAVKIIGNGAKVLPNNITTTEFTYLSHPTTPIFDYYLDPFGNVVYLPPSSSRTLGTGEVGSAGQTSGAVTSIDVELAWNQDYHMEYFNAMLLKLGINLANQSVTMAVKDAETKAI
jgi:hypothetical protein